MADEIQKRAMLVFVGDYRGYAETLEAAPFEMERWAGLLRDRYGFTEIESLTSPRATRSTVLSTFRRLIGGLKKHDQFVVIFGCHGRIVAAHSPSLPIPFEEAVLVYPAEGDTSLASAEITDSDLARIAEEERLAAGVDFTVIVDSCFAGGFGGVQPLRRAKQMFVESQVFTGDFNLVQEFGTFGAIREFATERPVVIAACRRDQGASHLEIEGLPRMLFSWRALKYLDANPQTSYQDFVANIRPLMEGVEQEAELRVNRTRDHEIFPGEAGAEDRRLFRGEAVREQMPLSSPPGAVANADAIAQWKIDIRVEGICCFAGARRESDPYKQRVLLPADDHFDPLKKHVAFIEIAEDHVETSSGITPKKIAHHGGSGLLYHLWVIDGCRVTFENANQQEKLVVLDAFTNHVPSMLGIYPKLRYHPKDDCFAADPGRTLVSAYFDLNCGTLSVGPLEDVITQFKPKKGFPTSPWKGRAPEWVTLQLPITDRMLSILIEPYASVGGPSGRIKVKPGGSVRVGNARMVDITHTPGHAENPREHFMLYYKLSADTHNPDDLPLPIQVGVPTNACSPTGWP